MSTSDERIVQLAGLLVPHQVQYELLICAYRRQEELITELLEVQHDIRRMTDQLYDKMVVSVIVGNTERRS